MVLVLGRVMGAGPGPGKFASENVGVSDEALGGVVVVHGVLGQLRGFSGGGPPAGASGAGSARGEAFTLAVGYLLGTVRRRRGPPRGAIAADGDEAVGGSQERRFS
ncbi:hypothetical protein GCM10009654_15360 [Streptomyces hebeiensis]|uniref:Uncharacterized protein n=1 Tax=Streptomyces hebeiensis TaxID=229486 RepID=A0ABN1UP87_9ACTN